MATTVSRVETTPDYFEAIYVQGRDNPTLIPWNDEEPSPALVNWLNAAASSVIRCGARVAVVGCGLGYDAQELMRRGYDVTAFDCSPTAIEWARSIDPPNAGCYVLADLFDPPARWRHRFDLVVEINTLHSLQPEMRGDAAAAIASLLSPHGRLLVICRGRGDRDEVEGEGGPIWPLSEKQLKEVAALAGLVPEGPVSCFLDDEAPPVRRIRAIFRRA